LKYFKINTLQSFEKEITKTFSKFTQLLSNSQFNEISLRVLADLFPIARYDIS